MRNPRRVFSSITRFSSEFPSEIPKRFLSGVFTINWFKIPGVSFDISPGIHSEIHTRNPFVIPPKNSLQNSSKNLFFDSSMISLLQIHSRNPFGILPVPSFWSFLRISPRRTSWSPLGAPPAVNSGIPARIPQEVPSRIPPFDIYSEDSSWSSFTGYFRNSFWDF